MAINASIEAQHKLIEVAEIDTKIIQLKYQLSALAEIKQVQDFEVELGSIELKIVAAQTEVSDLTSAQSKAESDVEQVKTRMAKDQSQLDSGNAAPRELEGLQHELGTLLKRHAELEDVELEIMQQLEDAESALDTLNIDRDKVENNLNEIRKILQQKTDELNSKIAEQDFEKKSITEQLPKELVNLYEKIRMDHGDTGAALLTKGACQGCHISLDPTQINQIKTIPDDQVIRCEQCSRILIRSSF